jgi:hypothetical protein
LIHRNVATGSAITESTPTMRWLEPAAHERASGHAVRIDTGGKTMDNLSFGTTMTVVGVGGTFLTLWILSLVVDLLKKIYPLRAQDEPAKKA